MTFLVPMLAVAGAAAMAIPIIIHLLLRQRRRPVEWAAMRFLIEAFKKQKRRLQLEQIILLATRCLIVGLLGVALARPALQAAGMLESGGSRVVYLVVDTGMASGLRAAGPDGESAMAASVRQAEQILEALQPGDLVGVVAAHEPARALVVPPTGDHAAVVKLLRDLKPAETATDFSGAMRVVRQAIEDQAEALAPSQTIVYALSEFRQGSASLDVALPDVLKGLGDDVVLLAAPAAEEAVSNVQVVGVDAIRHMLLPGTDDGSGQVTVRLRRTGGLLDRELSRVRLTGDDVRHIQPRDVMWDRGQSEAEVEFRIDISREVERRLGFGAAVDADVLSADDQRFAVLDIRNRIRLLLVDRRDFGLERRVDQLTAGQWLRRAIAPTERNVMEIAEVEPAALDVADLRVADVVALPRPDLVQDGAWLELRKFVDRGGLLIVMPPSELNVHQWSAHLETTMALGWKVNREVTEVGEGLALAATQPVSDLLRLVSSELTELAQPVVTTRVLGVTEQRGSARTIIEFADGSPMVIVGTPGEQAEAPVDTADAPSREAGVPATPRMNDARGLVVYLACAPELSWTNLPSKPLMVPLIQEIVRQGLSTIRSTGAVQVGERPVVGLAGIASELVDSTGARAVVGSDGRVGRAIERSGLYEVRDVSAAVVGLVAVNVPVAAGRTDAQSQAAVSAWLSGSGPWKTLVADDLTAALTIESSGSPISGLLLLVVMVLILAEMLMARWFSHAHQERSVGGLPASGSAGTGTRGVLAGGGSP